MTRNQFIKLQENFAEYAKVKTTYKSAFPRRADGKKYDHNACLWGIGVGALSDFVILADMGHRVAIHFEDVKLPKLAY